MTISNGILAFEKKKLVLPLALLLLFSILLYAFLMTGSLENKYACAIISKTLAAENNMPDDPKNALQEAVEKRAEVLKILKRLQEDTKPLSQAQPLISFSSAVLDRLDPFLPYPCEFYPEKAFCSYYSSPETYACGQSVKSIKTIDFSSVVGFRAVKPYSYTFPLLIILNILWLSGLGYLLSGLALFAFRKVRMRYARA
ncbi:MAG: hypothetical protein HYX24_00730 [Candidatus Aenigmarchaeota archaeon]|nr:hypothetical protein [Candidatus Aenigmarchaeota archaeon]